MCAGGTLVKGMKATGVLLFARPDGEDSPTFAKTARWKGRLGYGDAKSRRWGQKECSDTFPEVFKVRAARSQIFKSIRVLRGALWKNVTL